MALVGAPARLCVLSRPSQVPLPISPPNKLTNLALREANANLAAGDGDEEVALVALLGLHAANFSLVDEQTRRGKFEENDEEGGVLRTAMRVQKS